MERNAQFFEYWKTQEEDDADFDEILAFQDRRKRARDETGRGGSVLGRKYINRDYSSGHIRIMEDYFVERPVFSEQMFRRRFRMRYAFAQAFGQDTILIVVLAVEKRCSKRLSPELLPPIPIFSKDKTV
jgi:hypothetical protein